jgi:hypothetical protein
VSLSAWFFAYGVAGLGLGGMWGLATGLYVHHARRSRVSRRVADVGPSARGAEEDEALLGGVVESPDDDKQGPVLWTSVSAAPGRGKLLGGRPFMLALGSGAKVRVEPEDAHWSLDTTFVPLDRGGHTVYSAVVRPGDEIFVRGALRREHDRLTAGRGYRDAARTWVMRGQLAFFSAAVVASHAARAAFHGMWALVIGVFFFLHHALMWEISRADRPPVRIGLLTVPLVVALGIAYWLRTEATAPWLQRKVHVE